MTVYRFVFITASATSRFVKPTCSQAYFTGVMRGHRHVTCGLVTTSSEKANNPMSNNTYNTAYLPNPTSYGHETCTIGYSKD